MTKAGSSPDGLRLLGLLKPALPVAEVSDRGDSRQRWPPETLQRSGSRRPGVSQKSALSPFYVSGYLLK